jgi:hypothetical protein
MELLPRVEEDVDAEEEDRDELEDAPVVADEVPELDVSLLPADEPLLDALLDRPPPPLRVTDTVMEVPPPEVSMLTDMPPRRPANCGAFKEA